jgi:hypothetical protein
MQLHCSPMKGPIRNPMCQVGSTRKKRGPNIQRQFFTQSNNTSPISSNIVLSSEDKLTAIRKTNSSQILKCIYYTLCLKEGWCRKLAITSSNLGRFATFCHSWKGNLIWNNNILRYSFKLPLTTYWVIAVPWKHSNSKNAMCRESSSFNSTLPLHIAPLIRARNNLYRIAFCDAIAVPCDTIQILHRSHLRCKKN